MKQLSLILALTALLGTSVFAQSETDEKTTGFFFSGEIRARGWIGDAASGANLNDDDTHLVAEYKFTEYTGVVFGINADGAPGTVIDLHNVYGYTDILRELGVQAVGLRIKAGKLKFDSAVYNPGSFGAGDDSIQSDGNVDKLNMMLEFNVSPDIVPLIITLASDLDFGYRNSGKMNNIYGNNGFSAFAQVALDNMTIADAVTLGINVYGNVRNNSVDPTWNKLVNKHADYYIGGTIGVGILNLPVDLKIGGSIEYYNVYKNNVKSNGIDGQAAVAVAMPDIFSASIGYSYDSQSDGIKDDANMRAGFAGGHFIGLQASLDLSKHFRPYAGIGVRLDKTHGRAYSFADYSSAEVGLAIIPVENYNIYIGWNRTGMATNGGDIQSPTKQDGWGSIYIKTKIIF